MPLNGWDGIKKGADLEKYFKDPPREFSLLPFWAWNDTLEEERLRIQIDEMLDKGVYGAFMHARTGIENSETPYFSEGWWEAVKIAVEHGARKGFLTILYDEDKWPSGSAGGRVVAASREYSKRGVKVDRWEITGPRKLTLDFSGSTIAILVGKLIGQASLDPDSIIDLTDHKGSSWQVPEGLWSITHFHELSDSGIQIDYLSKEAVCEFIALTHEEYHRRFGEHFGRTIPGIFFDEIYADLEGADLVWSKDFLHEFKERKGYDLRPYLPYLIYHAGPETPRIRCDYFDVFSSLYTEAWFDQIANWCEEHQIWLTGHTLETIRDYQNQGDYFRTWGPVQIPGTDNEDYRYSFPRRVRWYKAKQLSSLAHIYGKKRAMVEALGGGGWVVPFHDYKIGLALLGVYGLNMFVPHLFHYSVEKPECLEDWPPSWFYQNPYWKYFRKLADFGRRIAFMGSLGRHVCDVCVLHPITTLWAGGMNRREDVGTLGGGETGDLLEIQYNAIQQTLLENLIDYDIIDPESVIAAKVSGKRLHLADEGYAVLILPPLQVIRRSVAAKVEAFFKKGGTVIAMNQLPTGSMEGGENDGYVIEIFERVFGFDPRSLRIGYFETDGSLEKEYVVHTNRKGGRAYFAKATTHIPSILAQRIDRDVEVVAGDGAGLRVLHREAEMHDIYFLVNEQKRPKSLTLTLRTDRVPELWDPESGRIKALSNYSVINGKLLIPLTLEAWDACYLVCHSSDGRGTAAVISHTNLREANIRESESDHIVVDGWHRGDEDHIKLELIRPADGFSTTIRERLKHQQHLTPIQLADEWEFIPVPEALDQEWRADVSTSEVELPVMRFRWTGASEENTVPGWTHDDADWDEWKQVKIEDSYSTNKGCQRYLSSWDGAWINSYRYYRHWGVLGGDEVTFRRELNLENDVTSGWLGITADKSYALRVNNKNVGRGSSWKEPQLHNIAPLLNKGRNVITVSVNQCRGLLVQGELEFTDGRKHCLISDERWEVSADGGGWSAAHPYIYPPLGPWGEVPVPNREHTFPVVLWYRQYLPVGARAISNLVISGEYELFVNGQQIEVSKGCDETDISHAVSGYPDILTIKVIAEKDDDGILEPVRISCGKGKIRLGPWNEQGLSWYSGRAVYSSEFALQDDYIDPEIKLILDLGEVRYCAEIWVNDELVTYHPWPPYTADITAHVREGRNKISIVVANLLANRRLWDIPDEKLTDLRSRFNHEGTVLREKECLISGLLGPVQVVPYRHVTFELSN
ncbi:MAG: hypothetical protein JSW54_13725 [Fidelibacterota bacterium]|nr:MAG: hypothetical protein JSW54_13725 [Candidatus Neomarinimicrobiota bacterium]